jgi:hypothetical protein
MDKKLFYRRLRLYLTGVFLGFGFIYFTLIRNRDRNFSFWFPKNRIEVAIKEKQILLNKLDSCIWKNLQLDTASIKSILIADNLNISNSRVEKNPNPDYYFEAKHNNHRIAIWVELSDKFATVTVGETYPKINSDCK